MNYRWINRECKDELAVKQIISELNVPSPIARVLVGRGIDTIDAVQRFFEPSLDKLHSPWLMDGMELAVDRIDKAIEAHEMIWIHGDYDVDGTASAAMVLHFLRKIGANANYHIPSRLEEGFGFTPLSVERAREAGATVVVTVDVGVTASRAVDRANELGIDVIICDHHQQPGLVAARLGEQALDTGQQIRGLPGDVGIKAGRHLDEVDDASVHNAV